MSDATLKPCPFCGGEAHNDRPTWRVFGKRTSYEYAVACSNCEASSPGDDDERLAITAWNTRADAAEIANLQARIDALVEALLPFAEALQGNYSHQMDSLLISMGHGKDDLRWVLPLGDFRRARAAITAAKVDRK